MAGNNFLSSPIIVSASMSQSYKAATASALGTLRTLIVQKLRWENPGASQTLSIGDPISGNILALLKSNASGEDVIEEFIPERLWSDFEINSLPAGSTLLIFTR